MGAAGGLLVLSPELYDSAARLNFNVEYRGCWGAAEAIPVFVVGGCWGAAGPIPKVVR